MPLLKKSQLLIKQINKARITTVNVLLIIPHFDFCTYSNTYTLHKWGASSHTLYNFSFVEVHMT